jgi:hypothetical protein
LNPKVARYVEIIHSFAITKSMNTGQSTLFVDQRILYGP